MGFTSLAYLMDIDWLQARPSGGRARTARWAWTARRPRTTRRTWRATSSRSWTARSPARTGHRRCDGCISRKAGSTTETRPIGIPTLEDKVLQRAVVMLLEPIYEQDFYDCSYGFRPRTIGARGAGSPLEADDGERGGWILEVDIRKFFDTLDHAHLRAFLQQRVRDGVVLRLIGKWLNAGVMEDGSVSTRRPERPQGGVVSPVLANVYLHYVLDQWFAQEVQPRLQGRAYLVRYADDFVIGFTEDATPGA